MSNPWSPFYWRDYVADTGHLTLEQHGAYLILMAHYYMTARPLPANATLLHRIGRCATDAERAATEQVVNEFFVRDGDIYRHKRIDRELVKAGEISTTRRAAANVRHQKLSAGAREPQSANAQHLHVQLHPQPQPQPQSPSKSKLSLSKAFVPPTLEQVTQYCQERGNRIDPQYWVDYYSAIGWKVGRNPMKDWRAAVRTWERRGNHDDNRNLKGVQVVGECDYARAGAEPTTQREYVLPDGLDEGGGVRLWQSGMAKIKATIDPHSYGTWFPPLKVAGILENTLYIKLPFGDFSYVGQKFAESLAKVFPGVRLEFVAPSPIPRNLAITNNSRVHVS